MPNLWPWLAVAGFGALHGLNPACGWIAAAACGLHSHQRLQALRALAPIAVGHTASVALVAGAVALRPSMDRVVLQGVAAGLLVVVAAVHLSGRRALLARVSPGQAGLALWSFMVSTAHGAGLMLVPALVPLCMGNAPGREITASGSLAMALAAVGVHTLAMLAVTGATAAAVSPALRELLAWLRRHGPTEARSRRLRAGTARQARTGPRRAEGGTARSPPSESREPPTARTQFLGASRRLRRLVGCVATATARETLRESTANGMPHSRVAQGSSAGSIGIVPVRPDRGRGGSL